MLCALGAQNIKCETSGPMLDWIGSPNKL